jgi:hypothetical protein
MLLFKVSVALSSVLGGSGRATAANMQLSTPQEMVELHGRETGARSGKQGS